MKVTLVCFIVVMYGSPTSRPSLVLYVRIRQTADEI